MRAERVVCDTNVLISAAIVAGGKPRTVIERIRSEGILLSSTEGLTELETRLARPKFDKYLSGEARATFRSSLLSIVEIVATSGALRVCRDPDDDKILESAIEGRAQWLVTGDKDLLVLRPCGEASAPDVQSASYAGVAIVTPAEFLELIDR